MRNKTKFKKSTVASALLLAASPVLANTKLGGGQPQKDDDAEPTPTPPSRETRTSKPPPIGPGGKNFGPQSKFRIESITVDKLYKRYITSCAVPKVKQKSPRSRSILSLAFQPNRRQVIKLLFEMSNIPASKDEHVLLLLYSRCLSKKPKIKTPLSKNKLALDVNDLEILGTYNIPADPQAQSSSSASKKSSPATEMILEVDLELAKLVPQVNVGNDTFYFQTALMKKTDFERKHYGVARLSPLEAIHVTKKTCPAQKELENELNSVNESCKKLPTKTE